MRNFFLKKKLVEYNVWLHNQLCIVHVHAYDIMSGLLYIVLYAYIIDYVMNIVLNNNNNKPVYIGI